jgi:UPF0176 protein
MTESTPFYTIKSLYAFEPLDPQKLEDFSKELTQRAQDFEVLGLLILGKEGFNSTITSKEESSLQFFLGELLKILGVKETSLVKTSYSEKRPFRRFDVKIRPEIVTLARENYVPTGEHRHVSPEKWQELMQQEDVVVIDTRNTYETKIGKFKKAIDLKIDEFTDFPDKIKTLDSDKEKPHLIYCTGGIRCEKAIFEMEAQGFKNVYQLEGGILNYLEQFPEADFEGECFVFDSRVAVDQDLQPSKNYSLCPHCGDVSSEEVACLKCDSPTKLCEKCYVTSKTEPDLQTCSKNCRHHYKLRPGTKSPQQRQFYHED